MLRSCKTVQKRWKKVISDLDEFETAVYLCRWPNGEFSIALAASRRDVSLRLPLKDVVFFFRKTCRTASRGRELTLRTRFRPGSIDFSQGCLQPALNLDRGREYARRGSAKWGLAPNQADQA
jgi:hypothetical protein